MMPGFTDAGAGSAYVPKDVIPRRTAATTTSTSGGSRTTAASAASAATTSCNTDDDHNDNAPSRAEDTFSEAGTELHDNRTNKKSNDSLANRDRYYKIKTSVFQDNGKSSRPNNTVSNKHNQNNVHSDDHGVNTSNDSIEVEATFGFFPSTKPPPSPSPRGNAGMLAAGETGIESNDKFNKTPKRGTKPPNMPLSPSPQPVSPPPVTRKQLSASKRAGDADDSNQKTELATNSTTTTSLPTGSEGSQNDKHNTRQTPESRSKPEQEHFSIPEQPIAMQRGMMKREVSTFSLAPETGAVLEREENQAKLKKWKEKGVPNEKIDEGEKKRIRFWGR